MLDAFWSRASSTVQNSFRLVNKQLKLSRQLGMGGPYEQQGHLPSHDHCGYEVAVSMVLYSKGEGKYHKSHLQFDTVRKLRSVYSNFIRSSVQGNQQAIALGTSLGKYQRLCDDSCASFWFERFIEGMKRRMGQDWRPNKAFSQPILSEIFKRLERKIQESDNPEELNCWMCFQMYCIVVYVTSLRGNEGLLLDLRGLNKYNNPSDKSTQRHCLITLLGRVKGEQQDRTHIIPCVNVTSSGIQIKKYLYRFLDFKRSKNQTIGPAMMNLEGKLWSIRDLDGLLHTVLEEVHQEKRHLFPLDVSDINKLHQSYQCYRSFRRGSNTRAQEMGVHEQDIRMMNRWRRVDQANGTRAGFLMPELYTDMSLILSPFLRYTKAM